MTEIKLWFACSVNDVATVKDILVHDPDVDLSWRGSDGRTALHMSCLQAHLQIVELLLTRRHHINVNQGDFDKNNPLSSCRDLEVLKLLLKDPRINVNQEELYAPFPLWRLVETNSLLEIKWLVALRGHEVDFWRKARSWGFGGGRNLTAADLAEAAGRTEIALLLRKVMANPVEVRHELCVELGVTAGLIAEVFGLMVFLSDDYLRIVQVLEQQQQQQQQQERLLRDSARFMRIAVALPMELQMVLAHRTLGRGGWMVKTKDSEMAFRRLAYLFEFRSLW